MIGRTTRAHELHTSRADGSAAARIEAPESPFHGPAGSVAVFRTVRVILQGGEKVRTAEEGRRYEYEPPAEPIQFIT